ncbi:MAG: 50S ribosomal protein L17 [Methanomicrobia archaeon]|nr:50S ribosomal protein L17 [Methanomicrobia archaeon]
MRHGKHRHVLGCVKEHRKSLMANLAVALITHDRINTTLAKAKALRPFIEKLITLAKKSNAAECAVNKLHFRRMAIAEIRDESAAKVLFDEKVVEFLKRNGGYTRIYKMFKRVGDGADMAIIEFVKADDAGYSKARRKRRTTTKKSATVEAVTTDKTKEEVAA